MLTKVYYENIDGMKMIYAVNLTFFCLSYKPVPNLTPLICFAFFCSQFFLFSIFPPFFLLCVPVWCVWSNYLVRVVCLRVEGEIDASSFSLFLFDLMIFSFDLLMVIEGIKNVRVYNSRTVYHN